MVRLVQRHGLGVVIDRDIHMAADGLLDTGARAAAPCEQIDDKFVGKRQDKLGSQHGADGCLNEHPESHAARGAQARIRALAAVTRRNVPGHAELDQARRDPAGN